MQSCNHFPKLQTTQTAMRQINNFFSGQNSDGSQKMKMRRKEEKKKELVKLMQSTTNFFNSKFFFSSKKFTRTYYYSKLNHNHLWIWYFHHVLGTYIKCLFKNLLFSFNLFCLVVWLSLRLLPWCWVWRFVRPLWLQKVWPRQQIRPTGSEVVEYSVKQSES